MPGSNPTALLLLLNSVALNLLSFGPNMASSIVPSHTHTHTRHFSARLVCCNTNRTHFHKKGYLYDYRKATKLGLTAPKFKSQFSFLQVVWSNDFTSLSLYFFIKKTEKKKCWNSGIIVNMKWEGRIPVWTSVLKTWPVATVLTSTGININKHGVARVIIIVWFKNITVPLIFQRICILLWFLKHNPNHIEHDNKMGQSFNIFLP